jgi:hypothetical protein
MSSANKQILLIIQLLLVITFSNIAWSQVKSAVNLKHEGNKKVLKLLSEFDGPVISADHEDVISSNNKSGFETGQVIKLNGVYHMFVNEMFNRPHLDMRIAYWTSKDAIHWKRQSTIKESMPVRSPNNLCSEVWVSALQFNEDENAWNIFYVAYRGGDSSKGEVPNLDYAGRIWRAKSSIKGIKGIAGPYTDIAIVLQPDSSSQAWEGQQAVASFSPYHVGYNWYAIYDGHFHTPKGPWPDGMASAKKLSGPWKRMPESINPLKIVDTFAENHVISRLKNGSYFMVFDSFGDQEIGYSTSTDGIHWAHETRVKVQSQPKVWAENGDHLTRTPLCAIEEEDGSFTIVYTAVKMINKKKFYAIGKCSLGWEDAKK